jgi:hypothetical protein
MGRPVREPFLSGLAKLIPLILCLGSQAENVRGQESSWGEEKAVPHHLQDGDEYRLPLADLLRHGERLFLARWTREDGAGRPMAKGTGAPLVDQSRPLTFPRAMNRVSGPDANSCTGCHNVPAPGGGGDFVANVFVLGQRFDFASFDSGNDLPTRGALDEQGQPVGMASIANPRATVGMFGAGYVEMLARQITRRLRQQRDALAPEQSVRLEAYGIGFGTLARRADGSWDAAAVEGLPPPSLKSADAAHPPSLTILPFHQAGAVVSLRQFTNTALNQHHGLQSAERFGKDSDPDGDGVRNELTGADVAALTLFQAVLPVPGRVIPRDTALERAVALGEEKFAAIGCARCHVPALPLVDRGWWFTEPNPDNPPGNLRPQAGQPSLAVDLNDPRLPGPRLREEHGITWVPVFTDFKLHDITTGPGDPNREPLDQHAEPGTPEFSAGNGRFITRRLWGAASEPPYFHHGQFTTLREAIEAHAGEAAETLRAFRALSDSERGAVIEFLKTLRMLPQGSRDLAVDEQGRKRTWREFPQPTGFRDLQPEGTRTPADGNSGLP